jgi:hypothetical protein
MVAISKLVHKKRMKEVQANHPDLEQYLREVKVNGIKHTIKGTVDPDSPNSIFRIL